MASAVRLSDRGTITLPLRLREEMGLKSGQEFTPVAKGSVGMLVPVEDVRALRGSARGARTDGIRDKER